MLYIETISFAMFKWQKQLCCWTDGVFYLRYSMKVFIRDNSGVVWASRREGAASLHPAPKSKSSINQIKDVILW